MDSSADFATDIETRNALQRIEDERAECERIIAVCAKRNKMLANKVELERKLEIITEYQSQKVNTNKIDSTINYYEQMLLMRPKELESHRNAIDNKIESEEHKLEVLKLKYEAEVSKHNEKIRMLQLEKQKYDSTTDTHTANLKANLQAKKEEKLALLEKHKSKEQVALEIQLRDINSEIEQLEKEIEADRTKSINEYNKKYGRNP